MKSALLLILSIVFSLSAQAQCGLCQTRMFGSPYGYELTSRINQYNDRVFGKNEKYAELALIDDSTDEFLIALKSIKQSLVKTYSQRFSDSCEITQLKKVLKNPEVAKSAFVFRAVVSLRITAGLHYKFGLDMDKDYEILPGQIPLIPDTVLFSKIIPCCKIIQLAKADKVIPLNNVTDIDLLHVPFPHENFPDKSITLVWMVRNQSNKRDKKGSTTITEKYIDAFTGKMLKHSIIKIHLTPILLQKETRVQ